MLAKSVIWKDLRGENVNTMLLHFKLQQKTSPTVIEFFWSIRNNRNQTLLKVSFSKNMKTNAKNKAENTYYQFSVVRNIENTWAKIH